MSESEFGGIQRRNTLPKKPAGADLDAHERMRLMKLTGTEDINASPDGHRSWNGWARSPDSIVDDITE